MTRTAPARLCAALLLALVPATQGNAGNGAAPDRVYLSFGAKHVGIDPTLFGRTAWQEIYPGVILTWEDRAFGLDYGVGAFLNSFERVAAYASAAKFWDLGPDLSVGLVVGLADYGPDARFISTEIGGSGVVVTGGPQVNWRNLFLQVQPVPQSTSEMGAIFITGLTVPLGD
jgi:hypothetical protein